MARYVLPSSVLIRQLADEAVLLDLDRGEYYGLDEVGTHALNLLTDADQASIDTVARELARRYDAGLERIRADVAALVEALTEARLLERRD